MSSRRAILILVVFVIVAALGAWGWLRPARSAPARDQTDNQTSATCGTPSDPGQLAPANQPAPTPHPADGHADLDYAVVDLAVSGWLTDSERGARAGKDVRADQFPAPKLSISFAGKDAYTLSCEASPANARQRLFLRPGSCSYSAMVTDELAAYADIAGTLVLRKGQVQPLEIVLKPLSGVTLRLVCVSGEDLVEGKLQVSWIDPRGRLAPKKAEYAAGGQAQVVRRIKGRSIVVTGVARGWSPVAVEVADDATQAVVELKEKVVPPSEIKLLLPKFPDVFLKEGYGMNIYARRNADDPNPVALASFNNSDPGTEFVHELGPGTWEIMLYEAGVGWGYPGGIMGGPVQVTVEAGKTAIVNIPPLALPPWKTPTGTVIVQLTCEGRPMSYQGPIMYCGKQVQFNLGYNVNTGAEMGNTAVLDSGSEIALQDSAPEKKHGNAYVRHDFECRLEVRVLRDGKPVDEKFTIIAEMGEGENHCSCQAEGGEGKPALLWLPSGRAKVRLAGDEEQTVVREVDVWRGQRAVVEIELH